MKKTRIDRIENALATATGGRKAWDSEALHSAALSCASGGKAHEFSGRPEDANAFAAFAAAWKKAQSASR